VDVQVDELQVDSHFTDLETVVSTVEVAVADFFAREGLARELAVRAPIGSIDLGRHDERARAQNARSRIR
jgi:hypothetical protein